MPRETDVPFWFSRAVLPRVLRRVALRAVLLLNLRADSRLVGCVRSDFVPSRFAPGLIAREDDVRLRCVMLLDLPLGT